MVSDLQTGENGMKLFIKNMVSDRCKMFVQSVLEKMGFNCNIIRLGEAEITENLSEEKINQLKVTLFKYGFELLNDKKSILVEKIKNIIIEMIHYSDEKPKATFSNYLSDKLNYDYTYLSNLFSKVRGMTIEHFIILHKTERVKEMLVYTEYSIYEISRKLHFCSVQHMTNQFKKITGLRPSDFKKLKQKRLISLDKL